MANTLGLHAAAPRGSANGSSGRRVRLAAAAIAIAMSSVWAAAPARSQSLPSTGCLPGYSPAHSGCISENGRDTIETFRPIKGIRYVLGSKRVIGYFVRENGECRVTLMLVEEVDPMVSEPLTAARLVLSLRPGQSASLSSEEAETMLVTCAGPGDVVEVRRHSPHDLHAMR